MVMNVLEERKENNEMISKLKILMLKENISQKELAKKLGYSQAAVNTYLNNKYEGNLDEFERALSKFLDLMENRKKYKKIELDFVKTSVAARFFNIARICQLNCEIGLCTGVSGLGKTTAIKNYAKSNSGVIIVDPDENITVRTLLKLIGQQLKLRFENNTSSQEFSVRIVEKLNNSGNLIIVDEAENIDGSCFRTLRKIHDRCNFTFGLLFVGTERLASNLARMQGEFSYVTNRLGYIENLEHLTFEDSNKLIEQVFPNAEDDIQQSFFTFSKKNARLLFNLLKRTHDILMSSTDELNTKMIETAYKKISL